MGKNNCDHIYNSKHLFYRISKVVRKAIQLSNRICSVSSIWSLEENLLPCLNICPGAWPWVTNWNYAVMGAWGWGGKSRKQKSFQKGREYGPLGFPEPVSLAAFLWPSAGCSDQARLLGRVTNQPMYFHFLCLLRIFMQVKSVQGEIEGKRRKKGIMGLSKSNRDCSPSRGVTGLATEEDAPLACYV